jgi:hypothetical protein
MASSERAYLLAGTRIGLSLLRDGLEGTEFKSKNPQNTLSFSLQKPLWLSSLVKEEPPLNKSSN